MKNIMVTGGFGFIGSNYIRYMLNKYPDIRIINVDCKTYAANIKNVPSEPRLINAYCDIRFKAIYPLIVTYDIDMIVNFAAETHVDRSIHFPKDFIETNVVGVHNLLDWMIVANQRLRKDIVFHQISTDEVYGSLGVAENRRWIETDPYMPNSPYAASKASAEHFVRSYHSTFGARTIITNCSNNYGPYCNIEKFIPKAITNLLQNKKIPLYGAGDNVRDWIHVDDHCRALDIIQNRFMTKSGERQEYIDNFVKVNIGADFTQLNNLEILKKICGIMGKDESMIEHVADRKGHDKKYAIDCGLLNRMTGWKSTHNFEDGLRETIDWYKNNEGWWK